MAVDFGTFLGQNLGQIISDIIGKFKADPNKVIEMQEMVAQNASVIEQKQLELQGKLEDGLAVEVNSAAANIQAEAKSDRYTARARPTFLYIVEAILGFNWIVCPLSHGMFVPLPLDPNVLKLFGLCITGYTAFRSFDKFLSLPGDSSVKLGPLQIGNKS